MSKTSCKMSSKQIFCDTCHCYIPSVSLIESHNKGKRHQRLWTKIQKKMKLSCCSIFVRGFKKDSDIENDLRVAFGKYGCISDVYVDKEKCKYAIVQFEEECSVTDVLQSKEKLVVNGHKLIVKPRKQKCDEVNKSSKDSNDDSGNSHEDIFLVDALMDCNSISEQIEKLAEIKQLTTQEIELRFKVCELLEEVFKEVYSDCEVLPFGSTTSTLGSHGCDLDLTLLTDVLSDCQCAKPTAHAEEDGEKENPEGTSNASISSRGYITDICEILRKFAPGCKNVFPLRGAHCPLVKFEHKNSSLHCDLSINNRLGVRNSKLLSRYCGIDGRFRHLSYAIRTWATAKGIAGRSSSQLTKYAWAIMLIYFLQQCDPPVLPCLQDRKIDNANDCFIDGWDCYFDSELEAKLERQNTSSLGHLIAGFFNYFVNFDWKNGVICISTQRKQGRKDFLKQLEDIGKRNLFKNGPIWMPDPFELTHNIAHNLTEEGLKNLAKELRSARDIFMSSIEHGDIESNFTPSSQYSTSLTHDGNKLPSSKNGEDEFEGVNLLNLFRPMETRINSKRQKRPKLKFPFYVNGCQGETSKAVCSRCATVVYEILAYDLKMQCSYRVEQKHNGRPANDILSDQKSASIVSKNDERLSCKDACINVDADSLLEDPSERSENEDNICLANTSGDSSVIREYEVDKDMSVRKSLKDTATMKRSRSPDIDIAEPPLKAQHLSESSNKRKDTPFGSHYGADWECIIFTVTAWANTWTNRRQQRRMLDSLKCAAVSKVKNVCEGGAEVANQLMEYTSSHPSNVSVASSIKEKSVSESNEDVIEESSRNYLLGTDLQSGARDSLPSDAVLNKPIFVAEIKVTINEHLTSSARCKVVVKLIESEKLSAFHSFFAFFKKTVLQEMKQ